MRHAGFRLGNRPESARCNLCVQVGTDCHDCGYPGGGPAPRQPPRQGGAYSAFTQKKHSRTCEETPASGRGRPTDPPLVPPSHTVSLHHDRDIEHVHARHGRHCPGRGSDVIRQGASSVQDVYSVLHSACRRMQGQFGLRGGQRPPRRPGRQYAGDGPAVEIRGNGQWNSGAWRLPAGSAPSAGGKRGS